MQPRVRDLSPDTRHLIEQLLGHPVAETEPIFLRTIPLVKEAPPYEERLKIVNQMEAYFERSDKNVETVDARELEEAAEEAIREVRKARKAAL